MKSNYPTFPWWGFDDAYYRRIDAFKSKSPEELSKLAEHHDLRVKNNVASNIYSSHETIVKNPNVSNETLNKIIDGGFIGHERARDVLEERSKHHEQY